MTPTGMLRMYLDSIVKNDKEKWDGIVVDMSTLPLEKGLSPLEVLGPAPAAGK